MVRIATLITCYNRAPKTIECLEHLFNAASNHPDTINVKVYLTDDGSTDGTTNLIRTKFPENNITILQGDGNLFWTGGMINSWKEALKQDYDFFLLLNDDTNITSDLFSRLVETHKYSINNIGVPGIYIGTTASSIDSAFITYGGRSIKSRLLLTTERIVPNGSKPLNCDLGNANIMFVYSDVIKKIGIFSNQFTHSIADYDYTLTAKKNRIPVLVIPGVSGYCESNPSDPLKTLSNLNFKDRIKLSNSPKGFAFRDYLKYIRKHFIYRYPIVFIAGYLKVIYPKVYISLNKLRQAK